MYIRFIMSLFRYGTLHTSGEAFNLKRMEGLMPLKEFIPQHVHEKIAKETIHRKGEGTSLIRNLIGQFSFLKNSLRIKGSHLCCAAGKLCYIRIPKAANTSASKMMLQCMYPSLSQIPISDEQINYLTDVNVLLSVTGNDSNTYFTLVRNPLARLASVYHSFFEKENTFIYSNYLFGIFTPNLTFKEFVKRLATIPDRFKDQHLKPQSCFLEYYSSKEILVVALKLEEPEAIHDFLSPFKLSLPHLNKSESFQYLNYYDIETYKLATAIYQNDITRFGYSHDVERLKSEIQKSC